MQKLIFKAAADSDDSLPLSITFKISNQISKVKEELAKQLNLDYSQIILRYKGHELPNKSTISECSIENPNIILYYINNSSSIGHEFMSIKLINGPGNIIKVPRDSTIYNARNIIAKSLNLPLDDVFYYDKSSKQLNRPKEAIDINLLLQNPNQYFEEANFDHANSENRLLCHLPLNEDGTLHFVYQYKLLCLQVHLPNNTIAKSRCRDFATIETVKRILANSIDVAPENTVLTYNGEILSNDLKIRNIQYVPNAQFRLENYAPKQSARRIFLKISLSPMKSKNSYRQSENENPENEVVCATARFNENATVGKAKEKLAEFLNCDPQNISLLFNDPTIGADNSSLLKDLNIESDGVLDAEVFDSETYDSFLNSPFASSKQNKGAKLRSISIKLSNGLVAKGRFNETATVKSMKEVLASTLNLPPDCFSVINYGNQKETEEDINNELVKDLLFNRSFYRSSLIEANDDNDSDSNTLRESETLSVAVDDEQMKTISFLIQDGKRVNAQFKGSVTIGRVKEVLGRTLNVQPERIIFRFNEKAKESEIELGDNELLRNAPIPKNGTIFTSISSFPQKNRSSFVIGNDDNGIDAESDSYANSEPNEIEEEEEVQDDESFDSNLLENKEMENDEDEINVKIDDEDVIEINDDNNECSDIMDQEEDQTHPLILKTQDGTIAKTRYRDTATVKSLKSKMADVLDTNTGNIALSFDSKDMDDESLLRDILDDAENQGDLVLKKSPTKLKVIKPLLFRLGDGTEIKTRFRMVTTIGKIKDTLASILDVIPSKLLLYYEDEELQDDVFLSELRIFDGDCIYVTQE